MEIAEMPVQRRGWWRVCALALPVIGENLLQTTIGIVDTWLVSRVSLAALAGVGAALQVIFVMIAGLSALSVGASVLVAQAYGAGDLVRAGNVARQALVWALIFSLPVAVVGTLLSPQLVALFGLAPDVARIADDYLRVMLATITTLTVMTIAGGVLRGLGDTRTPLLVAALANIIHVVLSWALISGELGLPALGVVGAAWGTVVSRLVALLILVAVLLRGVRGVRISGRAGWRPQRVIIWGIGAIGLPAAMEELLVIVGFAMLTPIAAVLGTAALAAHRIVITLLAISFLPGFGLSLAATTLVGQAVGARVWRDARESVRVAMILGMVWMGGLGALFFLFAEPLVRFFGDDPQMVRDGVAALRIVAPAQVLWAGTFIYAGALRGTGDTRTPLIISSIAMWFVVGFAWLAVTFVQQSLMAVWVSFLIAAPLEAWLLRRAWLRTEMPERVAI